jgi:GR25 family glycosyltransferase involved in LPS biosynthesis
MQEIHVINLARDEEKWKLFNVCNTFHNNTQQNLKFTRFDAIDGKIGSDTIQIHPICDKLLCNPGIIGCAQSHITLWKDMVNKNESYRIIMEDDAKFDTIELKNILNTIDEYLQDKTDAIIISLMCIGPFCNIGKEMYIGNYKLVNSIFPLCTTAYIINNAAAKYILKQIDNTVTYHIDFDIARLAIQSNKNLKYFVVSPNIVSTMDTNTSIGTSHNKSLLLGWSKKLIWYCNVPIWKFGNLYTTILLISIFSLMILSYIRCKNIYIYLALFLIIELYIFNTS